MTAVEQGTRELTSQIYHGGNLHQARQRFGDPPAGWLDLSTGINSAPYPVAGLTPDDWTRLPGRDAEAALERTAADAYRMDDPDQLLVTPGTQAVIQALPWVMRAKVVAILGVTYQEHAARWRAAGAEVRIINSLDGLAGLNNVDALIVVNPNNPDGRLVPPDALLAAGERIVRRGGFVIVDEAFMDVLDPSQSLLPILPRTGYFVMRSFGKTWGLAGLRLGFLAGPRTAIDACRDFFGPWAVNGPALKIGAHALADAAWLTATKARLISDCEALDVILTRAGLDVVGGTPLFRLTQSNEAQAIFARLGQAGILVRPFPHCPQWLRFGVPATDADRARLSEALLK